MPAQRKSESPLKALRRSTSSPRGLSRSKAVGDEEESGQRAPHLDDLGAVHSLAYTIKASDVAEIIQHIQARMFDDIPDRSGLSSTRISETLNFRRSLPPLVTTTHVHALSKAPTSAEREIVQLINQGFLRKLKIPGRGLGSTSIGEFLVLTESWKDLVRTNTRLSETAKSKYIECIARSEGSTSVSSSVFTQQEVVEFVQAGLLTSSSASNSTLAGLRALSSGPSSLTAISNAGHRAAAGTTDPAGGVGAFHNAGGGGIAARASSGSNQLLHFSLPSVGVYLRLLAVCRDHLLTLLARSRPHETPVSVLKERWDGGVVSAEKSHTSRRLSASVLPARTRKWRKFYGIRFQWVLEECFSTGAIELFETGSVGLGARIPT